MPVPIQSGTREVARERVAQSRLLLRDDRLMRKNTAQLSRTKAAQTRHKMKKKRQASAREAIAPERKMTTGGWARRT